MPQETNPIQSMTQYDLDIMEDFLACNSALFNLEQEEIQEITRACKNVANRTRITDPETAAKAESHYVRMVSEVLDDIRENYPISSQFIRQLTEILVSHYDTLFSKLNMIKADTNASSMVICMNYYNCKNAKSALEQWLKTKGDYNKR